MKKITNFITTLACCVLFFSCKKEAVTNPPIEVLTGLTTIFQGTFTGSAHTTTGTVKLAKDAAGKKYLVFDNFKTDSGPDLRVWLSEDLKGTNYSEISNKVTNGTYQLEVDAGVDTEKKRKLLIWCKAFSVLFGSADLK
jgi:Electron transfer DM13